MIIKGLAIESLLSGGFFVNASFEKCKAFYQNLHLSN